MPRTFTVLMLAVLLAACGGGGDKAGSSHRVSNTGGFASSTSASYSYVNNGLEATFTLKGTSGKLEITNNSGKDVGAPAVYSLDPTSGDRVDATVGGAEPLADGTSGSYTVTFPDGFDAVAAGFVGLEFGGKDYGGFVAN